MAKKKKVKPRKKSPGSSKKARKRNTAKTQIRRTKKRKSRYKAKTKGVRYIALKLVKYFPNKYQKYQDALPRARELFQEIQLSGGKVGLAEIFPLVRKKREPKESANPPFLPEEMMDPIVFWEIEQNYPGWIASASNKLEFRSGISPEPVAIFQGGSNVDYQTHFKDFVNFSNKIFSLMRGAGQEVTSEEGAMVVTTPPVYDKKSKIWYSEIISCDDEGSKLDYGYDTFNPELEPDQIILPETGEKEKPSAPSAPALPAAQEKQSTKTPEITSAEVEPLRLKLKIEEEATKRAEIERSTQLAKTLETMNDLLSKDLITKLEWKEFYSSILNKMK